MRTRALLALAVTGSSLLLSRRALADAHVAVDPTKNNHAVSPLLFGVNFPSPAQSQAARLGVARWGGNSTTRYNYEIDVHNTAADYYFENLPGCWGDADNYCQSPPADPKEKSSANAFLQTTASAGQVALFTIPTMGFVPAGPAAYGHPFACSCTRQQYPDQDSFDAYDTNCGNGQKNGQDLDCNAAQVHTPTSPEWAKQWVSYIVSKFGPAKGKRIYALDNEPALWSSTHHDIRKERLGYDELWQRMRDYSLAILEADPTAEIAGPAEWGWPNYFCSDKDVVSQGCFPTSPDRAAHGGEELMAWLLQQAKAYELANGKRILHYLDLHYYPQGGSGPGRTRSLWDPSYTDPSWISDTIQMVPRMRQWVDKNYPGTKTAISEYDFYDHDNQDAAVTYAEVLGIFAREGLDLATAWSAPAHGESGFAPYILFSNYDGQGSGFERTYADATSDTAGLMAFAATGPTRLTVVLVNEGGSDVTVETDLGSFKPGASAAVYSNKTSKLIAKDGDVPVTGTKVSVTLAPHSVALLAIDGDSGQGTGGDPQGGGGMSQGGGGDPQGGAGMSQGGGGDPQGGSSQGGTGQGQGGNPQAGNGQGGNPQAGTGQGQGGNPQAGTGQGQGGNPQAGSGGQGKAGSGQGGKATGGAAGQSGAAGKGGSAGQAAGGAAGKGGGAAGKAGSSAAAGKGGAGQAGASGSGTSDGAASEADSGDSGGCGVAGRGGSGSGPAGLLLALGALISRKKRSSRA
jgi:hypothetical protein